MNDPLLSILDAVRAGTLTNEAALDAIAQQQRKDLGHTTLDLDRARRTGHPEVVYGEHKSVGQLQDIINAFVERGDNLLVTRLSTEKHQALTNLPTTSTYHDVARLLSYRPQPLNNTNAAAGQVAVVSAGTSDAGVAEEAAHTCEFFGNDVLRVNDVGVAGLHRLLARIEDIRQARVAIVVAGMEGALASVLGGLFNGPVIAVPTSVGYGASFAGVAALLAMLNSCAAGVSVVNIDNGFGAGYLADTINRL